MDDETLNIYIEESKEHLETIESDLLEIEQQGEHFDEELVNKVFRAAHSIKGGGGFLGLDNIKELAHKLENILHMVRSFELVPNQKIINALLAAYDRLGELIDNPNESNEMDISVHVETLNNLVSQTLPEEEKETLHTETAIRHPKTDLEFVITDFDLKKAQSGGNYLYIFDIDLIKDARHKDKTPLDIIKLLEDAGTVIDIKVEIASVGDLDSEEIVLRLPMHILYASIVDPELIGSLMNIDDENIHLIPEETDTTDRSTEPPKAAAASETEPTPPVESVEPRKTSGAPVAEESAAVSRPSPKENAAKATSDQPKSLRVNVDILDQLMNRAGELVLARNQLQQSISVWDTKNMTTAGQRIDLVTSELQEAIMLTRMQPVGIIFNKFPRVVRGLALDLGKKIELELEGKEVELDKTIIEGLGDPLTHLVRNSVDHGIELPEVREGKGKPKQGRIDLKASYESGQVIIEISDDGKGVDADKIAEKAINKKLATPEQVQDMSETEKLNLIMLPGFSTAEQVTDISGRGVGMDVVKTNLDKMGGQLEIISEIDKGSTFRIKLPLTLAIIPSLLVSSTDERFALPQPNVSELLRIPASEIRQRIEKIGGADVLILRGDLIPLLQLNNVLELKQTFYDFKIGEFKIDRRSGIADERLPEKTSPPSEADAGTTSSEADGADYISDSAAERRLRRESDVIIVVLHEGALRYGLVVDEVHDTVEIVVKPLGRHLQSCGVYAGATIMGDGQTALILDIPALARRAELASVTESDYGKRHSEEVDIIQDGATRQTLLLFHNSSDESCAVPLYQVLRVEQIMADDIEIKGGKKVIQYRGGNLPIFALEEVATVNMLEDVEKLVVVIFKVAGHEVGLLAVRPLDVVELDLVLDEDTLSQPGIAGSTIIHGKTTLMVDIFELIQILNPQWFVEKQAKPMLSEAVEAQPSDAPIILLAEDSQFFRDQVKRFIEEAGYAVVEAADGQVAWSILTERPDDFRIVVTDLEMPNMDGFELTRKIKADDRFSQLPIIALTSLAAKEDIEKGKEVGIDDYQIKMDKEKLLESLQYMLRQHSTGQ
ncbi:MAG: response regulator [Proteobacteria bacterium]|nr:response regulator [Pseudomonadota bacterium]